MVNFSKIIKNIFCIFILTFPLFFIPNANYSQALNQKIILFAFALLISVIFLIKILTEKKISIKHSWIQYLVFWFLSFAGLSAIFSKNISLSFWGSANQADSLLFLAIYVLIFFISINNIKRRNTINILECFIGSSAILSIMFLIQNFTKVNLAIFDNISISAILVSFALSIIISFIFNNINYFRGKNNSFNIVKIASIGVFFVLFIVSLGLMGYRLSWFFVSIGTFFALWRVMMETNFHVITRKSLLLIIMLISFLSIFFLSQTSLSESRLSYSDSWVIVSKTATEGFKSFLFGSGPSTYAYQFSLYENKDFNAMGLGSAVFNQSPIMIFTILPTIGILGTMSLLAAIVIFYIQGFRYFLNFRRRDNDFSINVNDILFPVSFSASLLIFFYKIDAISLAFTFLFIGLWVANQAKEEGVFEISEHYKKTIYLIFCILLIVAFYFMNYCRGEILYEQAFAGYNNGGDIAQAINKMEKSSGLWKSTDGYISLSQLYAIQASNIFSKSVASRELDEQRQNIKDLVTKSEGAANFACSIDKNNFQAWQNLGLVYENTNYVLEDRVDDALSAYSKAEKLAPQNESIYLAEGRLLQTKKDFSLSLEKYEKALELNPSNKEAIKKIEEIKKFIK